MIDEVGWSSLLTFLRSIHYVVFQSDLKNLIWVTFQMTSNARVSGTIKWDEIFLYNCIEFLFFFFQIRRLCKVVYRKFDFARYPGHVRDPFTYAFKPIIIHVSLCMCLSRCLYFCCDDAMQAQR